MTQPARMPSAMDEIAAEFWEESLRLSPTSATIYGDHRFDDRLDDVSAAGRAAARASAERAWASAKAIPEEGLGTEDRITRDIIRIIAELAIDADDLRVHELRAVDQINGPQTELLQLTAFQPMGTPAEVDAWLSRLYAFGPLIDAYVEMLGDGLASGLVAARIVVERTIDQLHGLLATPAAESVIVMKSAVASESDRDRIRDVVDEVVYPALRRYLAALEGEYLAASRELPGLVSAPDGEALYRYFIRRWTTLDLDPREVHQIGLEELAQIDEERRAIALRAGFGDDVDGYRRSINEDPANQAPTTEDLVARANEDIERAAAVAPTVFGTLPRAACEVRPVEPYKEKDAPFAYYFPPAPDGSRPGIYYVNTYDLPSRTFSKLASTTYHEAIPGHHFQLSLETEHPTLGAFRRMGARIVGGAYLEGWGLYAERLADELGLYRDESERLGMLDAQAWRASRLIVDSGMHGLGWTRQMSIDWLLRTGLSSTDAVIETDRYICWPGQALSYMTGMREIRRLRAELAARDGDRFDLKAFHDEIIGHGSLPLATLTAELPRWVKPRA